jgi:zinc transporter
VRYVETLDVIRERATLLHDHLTAQISERIAQTSNRLTALAAILLPPSLVAGIFGMNVGGIPAGAHGQGFWIILGVLAALMAGQLWLMRRFGWL